MGTVNHETKKAPDNPGASNRGSDGRRSRDLSIFSRTLYQLSYRAEEFIAPRQKSLRERDSDVRDPDGT